MNTSRYYKYTDIFRMYLSCFAIGNVNAVIQAGISATQASIMQYPQITKENLKILLQELLSLDRIIECEWTCSNMETLIELQLMGQHIEAICRKRGKLLLYLGAFRDIEECEKLSEIFFASLPEYVRDAVNDVLGGSCKPRYRDMIKEHPNFPDEFKKDKKYHAKLKEFEARDDEELAKTENLINQLKKAIEKLRSDLLSSLSGESVLNILSLQKICSNRMITASPSCRKIIPKQQQGQEM